MAKTTTEVQIVSHSDKADLKTTANMEKFVKVFEKKLCNVKKTCEAVGISRQTYYNWLDRFDTFKKDCRIIEEGLYDDLESIMYKKAIVEQDNTMLIFLAKTKMKHRGFIEKAEIEVIDSITEKTIFSVKPKRLEDLDVSTIIKK